MCAWLKNASDTENDSSTSRSRCSSESGRRKLMNGSDEQHAHRQPDVQRVDVPAERAGVAARHRPRDLEAGPLFDDPPVEVVDDDEADLLLAALGEVADLPLEGALEVDVAEGAAVFACAAPASLAAGWRSPGPFPRTAVCAAGGTFESATGTGVSELVEVVDVDVCAFAVCARRGGAGSGASGAL